MTDKHSNPPAHPGKLLAEILKEKRMTQAECARRTGLAANTISDIVNGRVGFSVRTAFAFERVLGVPMHVWVNHLDNYRRAMKGR